MVVIVTIYKNLGKGYVVVVMDGMHYKCSRSDLEYVGGVQYTVDIKKLVVYAGEAE